MIQTGVNLAYYTLLVFGKMDKKNIYNVIAAHMSLFIISMIRDTLDFYNDKIQLV